MHFGTRSAFKSVIAARTAALLGWAAVAHGDRVGGLVWDGSRRHWQPSAGRERGLLPLLRSLAGGPAASPSAAAPAPDGAGFSTALQSAPGRVRPGSLVFLLSDFTSTAVADDAWLAHLSEHSEVMLIFVYDPIEANAPPAGRWPVCDAGGRRLLLDLSGHGRRALYESRFVQHRQRLQDLARRRRAHWLMLATVDAPGPALRRVFGGSSGP
jgi:uncharacterized protein (DUF58 family)